MSDHHQQPHEVMGSHEPSIAPALTAVMVLATGVWFAPSALADPLADLSAALVSARGETSCRPLQANPVVEQAADVVNRSTDDYLDHSATQVPIGDPLEGLKDLGYGGTKAYVLHGAGRSDSLAIKGALLQGYAVIADCSYTDFGVSMRRNETTGYSVASVVLAGT